MALKTSIQNVCKRLGYSVQELPNIIKVLQEGFADVATEAGDVDTAVSDVGTLKTRMTTAEGKIETLEDYTEYSTTEHVVGKWIDGRDVYEKVYRLESDLTLAQSNWTTTTIDISDMSEILEVKAYKGPNNWGYVATNISAGNLQLLNIRTAEVTINTIILKYIKHIDDAVEPA